MNAPISRPRVAISMYGGVPSESRTKVSGLIRYQESYASLLKRVGIEVIPFYFHDCTIDEWPDATLYERTVSGEHVFKVCRSDRRMYLPDEGAICGLEYPKIWRSLIDQVLQFLASEQINALHLIEWMPAGMALWQAALESGKPVVFTPTEHGAVCQYGFLLHNCGAACDGPGDGTKCARCTHSLEPYPPPASTGPWYSRRHQLFHQGTALLPQDLQKRALWELSERFQHPGAVISENEGRARVMSTRRFLRDARISVQYQSQTQHRVFERALDCTLPVRLPFCVPDELAITQSPLPAAEAERLKDKAKARPVIFLFAARPSFDRGLWFLLDAWERWAPSPTKARLLIYTHREGKQLERRVAKINRPGQTIDLVYKLLNAALLLELHREVHFVVNPAVWEEPGSATVFEGLKLGTPAIVPSGSGSAELIAEGATGYVFAYRDSDGLISALARAEQNMNIWPKLSKAGLAAAALVAPASLKALEAQCGVLFPGFNPDLDSLHRLDRTVSRASQAVEKGTF